MNRDPHLAPVTRRLRRPGHQAAGPHARRGPRHPLRRARLRRAQGHRRHRAPPLLSRRRGSRRQAACGSGGCPAVRHPAVRPRQGSDRAQPSSPDLQPRAGSRGPVRAPRARARGASSTASSCSGATGTTTRSPRCRSASACELRDDVGARRHSGPTTTAPAPAASSGAVPTGRGAASRRSAGPCPARYAAPSTARPGTGRHTGASAWVGPRCRRPAPHDGAVAIRRTERT